MKRGEIKRTGEDKRRSRNVARLLAEHEKDQEKQKAYDELTRKQIDGLYRKWDSLSREQKDYLDEYAIKHGVKPKINYELKYTFGREYSLSDAEKLLPVFNDYLLKEKQTPDMLMALLNCWGVNCELKNRGHFALFMEMCADNNKVCKDWKAICEINKLFIKHSGGVVTAHDLAKARDVIKERIKKIGLFNHLANYDRKLSEMINYFETIVKMI